MEIKSSNKNLYKASQVKKDEFYTQLVDIEKALKRYKEQFRGKVVFCNCDDPKESNYLGTNLLSSSWVDKLFLFGALGRNRTYIKSLEGSRSIRWTTRAKKYSLLRSWAPKCPIVKRLTPNITTLYIEVNRLVAQLVL